MSGTKYPKETYGLNMGKRPFDPKCCAEEVWPNTRGPQPYQCLRKPGHGERKLFCKQHAHSHPAPGDAPPPSRPPTKYEREAARAGAAAEERARTERALAVCVAALQDIETHGDDASFSSSGTARAALAKVAPK